MNNLWGVTAQQLQHMFRHVDSISAARLRVRRRAGPAPLPQQGPEAGNMSPVLGRPPRAPRSCPVNSGARALGVGEGTTATGKPTAAPRATDRTRRGAQTQGQEARQRGTLPAATTKQDQVPSNNGHQVPLTRTAPITPTQPRHGRRCQATPNQGGEHPPKCSPAA